MSDSDVMFELSATPDDSRFLVDSSLEILRTFRGLITHREMVSAFFNAGRDLLLTTVLAIDPEAGSVVLDCGSNPQLNRRILDAEKIIFVTSLDKVKVQWVSHALESTLFEGREAFRIRVPQQILQLQRREYYRLTTPLINPLICRIPIPQGGVVEVALADISAGGIGVIIAKPFGVMFEVGTLFSGCRVELPGTGTAEFTLSIQSIWEVTLKNGNKSLRAGCQFVDMRSGVQSLIQRYIIKLERERIANAPGH
jgi:flagellar brake protein